MKPRLMLKYSFITFLVDTNQIHFVTCVLWSPSDKFSYPFWEALVFFELALLVGYNHNLRAEGGIALSHLSASGMNW